MGGDVFSGGCEKLMDPFKSRSSAHAQPVCGDSHAGPAKRKPGLYGRGCNSRLSGFGFYPHPDLVKPLSRVIAYHDVTGERGSLASTEPVESWQWLRHKHRLPQPVAGHLSDGLYRGLAHECNLALVKVSERGRISEENIARGIHWVIANRERYNIRVLNISLGGDEDVSCSKSIIDQAAEEAIRNGIVVVAAAGNSGSEGRHSIPPANSPSVITVGGYSDNNQLNGMTRSVSLKFWCHRRWHSQAGDRCACNVDRCADITGNSDLMNELKRYLVWLPPRIINSQSGT